MADEKKIGKEVSRRTVLEIGGMMGLGVVLPSTMFACGQSGSSSTGDATPTAGARPILPFPPQQEGDTLTSGVRTFRLDVQAGSMEWVDGQPTATYAVDGDYLGPTLRFNRGERVRIEVTNSLDEATTMHWHGLQLPARADGGPYQMIEAGETWVTEFDIVQRPLMAWYHPHQMGATARHVYMGIAGLIIIDDDDDITDLPHTYSVDDLPLVIQDRRFSADGTHPYSAGAEPLEETDRLAGLKGETMLVNGAILPRATVPKGLVRLRILNGSNSRIYNLGFADDREFHRIGNEGGLHDAPIAATRILLAPAQRVDILVEFGGDDEGEVLELLSYSSEVFRDLFSEASGPRAEELYDDLDDAIYEIMSFEVGGPSLTNNTVPAAFTPIEQMSEANAVRTRQVELSMQGSGVYINNAQMLSMDNVPDAINFHIPEGDTEVWEVTSLSGMSHPLHIHNRHFQILDIDGEPPPPELAGWRDTVLLRQNVLTRLLLNFDGTTDPDFPYMFHCHILEHEDDGMMGQFYIV